VFNQLPHKCFISHSYKDIDLRERLVAKLPKTVEPFLFPPITVSPDEMVSNDLITAILDCDGLIYLNGGHSASSFWVALERDYALRSGKPVFAADPITLDIRPHRSPPLDLPVYSCHSPRDYDRIRRIFDFMRDERFMDLWTPEQDMPAGVNWKDTMSAALDQRLAEGGYAVVFWSQSAANSRGIEMDLRAVRDRIVNINDKLLFALLDDTPLPRWVWQFQEPAVQLYSDDRRSETNRIDDLIVRLYWLIYRHTQQARLEPEGTLKPKVF
jgi:hypothetical protein